jgi:hypothetical protein
MAEICHSRPSLPPLISARVGQPDDREHATARSTELRADTAVQEELMESRSFDAFTRRAALLTLGSVGLGTLASPLAADAKKRNRKRNKNKNKGDVNKLCKTQVGQCETFINAQCDPEDQECAALLACCSELATCDFDGFVACFVDVQQAPTSAPRLLR